MPFPPPVSVDLLSGAPNDYWRARVDQHVHDTYAGVQTINLAPSQGGWVEFTLGEEGSYPFVTHAFGDMVKGALGILQTRHAPAGHGH